MSSVLTDDDNIDLLGIWHTYKAKSLIKLKFPETDGNQAIQPGDCLELAPEEEAERLFAFLASTFVD